MRGDPVTDKPDSDGTVWTPPGDPRTFPSWVEEWRWYDSEEPKNPPADRRTLPTWVSEWDDPKWTVNYGRSGGVLKRPELDGEKFVEDIESWLGEQAA
jgi:hypothetical protein